MKYQPLIIYAVVLVLIGVASAQSLPTLNQQYRGNGISFFYPDGWQPQENRGTVVIAPADAHRHLSDGRDWITVGVIAGFYRTRESNLNAATDELVDRITVANPELRPISSFREMTVDGRQALVREYSNAASRDGIYSRNVILTVKVSEGVRFWQMGCPVDAAQTYLPVFDSIVRSIHFLAELEASDRTEAVAPARFYAEPSISLIRDTIQIKAGYTQHYEIPLERGSKLVAKFQVEGGLNNRVNVLLLDSINYQRYLSRQQFSYFKGTAGAVKDVGKYEFSVTFHRTLLLTH